VFSACTLLVVFSCIFEIQTIHVAFVAYIEEKVNDCSCIATKQSILMPHWQ